MQILDHFLTFFTFVATSGTTNVSHAILICKANKSHWQPNCSKIKLLVKILLGVQPCLRLQVLRYQGSGDPWVKLIEGGIDRGDRDWQSFPLKVDHGTAKWLIKNKETNEKQKDLITIYIFAWLYSTWTKLTIKEKNDLWNTNKIKNKNKTIIISHILFPTSYFQILQHFVQLAICYRKKLSNCHWFNPWNYQKTIASFGI